VVCCFYRKLRAAGGEQEWKNAPHTEGALVVLLPLLLLCASLLWQESVARLGLLAGFGYSLLCCWPSLLSSPSRFPPSCCAARCPDCSYHTAYFKEVQVSRLAGWRWASGWGVGVVQLPGTHCPPCKCVCSCSRQLWVSGHSANAACSRAAVVLLWLCLRLQARNLCHSAMLGPHFAHGSDHALPAALPASSDPLGGRACHSLLPLRQLRLQLAGGLGWFPGAT